MCDIRNTSTIRGGVFMKDNENEICLAIRRYNCSYDKQETEQWKNWVVAIQRPIEYVLSATLLISGLIVAIGMFVFAYYLRYQSANSSAREIEVFLIRGVISELLLMGAIYLLGSIIVLRRYPRPKLERCLEVHYCKDYFSLYYIYRKMKHKVFVRKYTYDSLDLLCLDENTMLLNGCKLELGNPDIASILTPEEQWIYRKFYGFIKGLNTFSYSADTKKFVDMIDSYRKKD